MKKLIIIFAILSTTLSFADSDLSKKLNELDQRLTSRIDKFERMFVVNEVPNVKSFLNARGLRFSDSRGYNDSLRGEVILTLKTCFDSLNDSDREQLKGYTINLSMTKSGSPYFSVYDRVILLNRRIQKLPSATECKSFLVNNIIDK